MAKHRECVMAWAWESRDLAARLKSTLRLITNIITFSWLVLFPLQWPRSDSCVQKTGQRDGWPSLIKNNRLNGCYLLGRSLSAAPHPKDKAFKASCGVEFVTISVVVTHTADSRASTDKHSYNDCHQGLSGHCGGCTRQIQLEQAIRDERCDRSPHGRTKVASQCFGCNKPHWWLANGMKVCIARMFFNKSPRSAA